MVGWVIPAGIVFGIVALKYFWEDIAQWLNNTAADAVERVLGYDAKKFMRKAVSRVTRVMNKLDNITTIFAKRNAKSTMLDKVTITVSAPAYEQDQDVLKELERKRELTNDFTYMG